MGRAMERVIASPSRMDVTKAKTVIARAAYLVILRPVVLLFDSPGDKFLHLVVDDPVNRAYLLVQNVEMLSGLFVEADHVATGDDGFGPKIVEALDGREFEIRQRHRFVLAPKFLNVLELATP